jgi:hypothetical protein
MIALMSKRFRVCSLDQEFLLPPSLQDWLPEDNLARFIADVVNELDLSGIYGTSRQADPARALVLFEDRFTAPAMTASGVPTSLLLSDGSAILEVLMLAQRLGVFLTP